MIFFSLYQCILDPWRFDTDPDPRLCTVVYGSGSGSCFFLHWLSRFQQKINCFVKVASLLLTLGTGTFKSVIKDNESLRSHKTVEINFFLVCLFMEGSGSVQIITDLQYEGEKT
jgi:hypothetical protein